MTKREFNIRSVLFLVIGILLLLSLIICIYLVAKDNNLQKTEAVVLDVKKDVDGTGKNEVKVSYEVDGTPYNVDLNYKDNVNVDDKITIYYSKKNVLSVTAYKTSKIIFVCPVIGLVLCILGLYELFKNGDDGEDEFKTTAIAVVGDTKQLKIVADKDEEKDDAPQVEEPTEEVEEVVEEPEVEEEVPEVEEEPVHRPSTMVSPDEAVAKVEEEKIEEKKIEEPVMVAPAEEPEEKEEKVIEEVKPVIVPNEEDEINVGGESTMVSPELPEVKEEYKEDEEKEPPKATVSTAVAAPEEIISKLKEEEKDTFVPAKKEEPETTSDKLVKEVKNSLGAASNGIDEEEIKKVIKDVLKEVIQEVSQEKKPAKPVEQKRALPNNYYILGTSLIFEEAGKKPKEIELKTIYEVIRTVNSEGHIVKLTVCNPEVKCILTKMRDIDLEQVADLLRKKLLAIDENFKETIENKEY